jgi:hypothetical protein
MMLFGNWREGRRKRRYVRQAGKARRAYIMELGTEALNRQHEDAARRVLRNLGHRPPEADNDN